MKGPTLKRHVIKLVVFLLLGAVINIAVAWGIGFSIKPKSFDGVETTGGTMGGPHYWVWHVTRQAKPQAVRIISHWDDEDTVRGVFVTWPNKSAAPLVPHWATRLSPEEHTPCLSYHYAIGWEYGWPMRSMGGVADARVDATPNDQGTTVHTYFAIPLEPDLLDDPNTHGDVRLLVFRPIWPGFAINATFYGVILWLPWFGLLLGRRLRRFTRGRCPQCAYDLRGDYTHACSECGWLRKGAETA